VPRFEETREVGAPAAICWQLLTDPVHIPTWLTVASHVHSDDDPGVGRQLRARGGALGVEVELDLEVTAWDLGSRYAWRADRPIAVVVDHELAEDGTVCRVRTAVEADLGARRSVRARLAVRVLRGEVSRSLDRFVELAESTPA
jgi:carbon monoxide dehydrogenase subunit G